MPTLIESFSETLDHERIFPNLSILSESDLDALEGKQREEEPTDVSSTYLCVVYLLCQSDEYVTE